MSIRRAPITAALLVFSTSARAAEPAPRFAYVSASVPLGTAPSGGDPLWFADGDALRVYQVIEQSDRVHLRPVQGKSASNRCTGPNLLNTVLQIDLWVDAKDLHPVVVKTWAAEFEDGTAVWIPPGVPVIDGLAANKRWRVPVPVPEELVGRVFSVDGSMPARTWGFYTPGPDRDIFGGLKLNGALVQAPPLSVASSEADSQQGPADLRLNAARVGDDVFDTKGPWVTNTTMFPCGQLVVRPESHAVDEFGSLFEDFGGIEGLTAITEQLDAMKRERATWSTIVDGAALYWPNGSTAGAVDGELVRDPATFSKGKRKRICFPISITTGVVIEGISTLCVEGEDVQPAEGG